MQRGADLKRRKCELQIETSQLTIEAGLQSSDPRIQERLKSKRRGDRLLAMAVGK